jgi:hypothetical protein
MFIKDDKARSFIIFVFTISIPTAARWIFAYITQVADGWAELIKLSVILYIDG